MKKISIFLLLFISSCFIQSIASANSREVYEKTGRVIWEVNTDEKIVAITFDDGPHPVFTPQILDILKKYDAKATFFVAGNKVKRFPDVLKRTAKEGHEIANHTYHHIYGRNITADTLTSELDKTDHIIKQITGNKPTLYRPVGGFHNDVIIHTAIKNGKMVVLWSWNQDPEDWKMPSATRISSYITKDVRPGNIILLHDWIGSEYSKTSQTVEGLKTVMEFLHKNNYKCVTVSELLYHSEKPIPEFINPLP